MNFGNVPNGMIRGLILNFVTAMSSVCMSMNWTNAFATQCLDSAVSKEQKEELMSIS